MKKFVTSLLAMVMLLSLCTGCGGQKDSSSTGDTASAGTPSAETVVLRLANSHNAEHITSQACQMFADLVNEKTDGRITLPVNWATSAPPSSSASSAVWTSPVFLPVPLLSSLL